MQRTRRQVTDVVRGGTGSPISLKSNKMLMARDLGCFVCLPRAPEGQWAPPLWCGPALWRGTALGFGSALGFGPALRVWPRPWLPPGACPSALSACPAHTWSDDLPRGDLSLGGGGGARSFAPRSTQGWGWGKPQLRCRPGPPGATGVELWDPPPTFTPCFGGPAAPPRPPPGGACRAGAPELPA